MPIYKLHQCVQSFVCASLILLVCGQAESQTPSLLESPELPALYLQALRAIEQNQPELAQTLLQNVINQHPQLAGAWIDLAMLALQQGRHAEADEYLLALEQKFSPLPAPISQAIARLRERLNAQLQPQTAATNLRKAQRQTALVLGSGYEHNANSGLSMSTITLTTPDGNSTLTVDPASQAQASAYVRAGLVHQESQGWLGGELNWQFQGQTRQYSVLSPYNTIELLPQVTMQHPQILGQVTLGWQAIWLHNKGTYQTPIVRWQLDQPFTNCNWRHQLLAEDRLYLQASQFDSHWLAYRSTWQCQGAKVRRQAHIQLAQEKASQSYRPGGDTRHQSLGIQQEWFNPFEQEGRSLQFKVDWLNAKDSSSYNSLLDNGKPRHLNRVDVQLTWSAPLKSQQGWRWSVGAQSNLQKSNIALFNQRNFHLETSIWRAW